MKLQVTQENLNKALGTVARVANTRGTLPVLANVLIKTVNNRVSIAATNLDIAVSGDGKYLYTLDSAIGAISIFAINSNGTLTSLGEIEGLPKSVGFNGIAAL